MPANPSTAEMGERHEAYLARINGGSQHRASGAVWFEPADGSNGHDDLLAFAWDGKATLGKSISVTRDMLAKIRDQALGRRPQIGLRFYGNPNLDDVDEDWVAVPGDNWEEVLGAARMWHVLLGFLLEDPGHARLRSSDDETILDAILGLIAAGSGGGGSTQKALAEAHQALIGAEQHIASLHEQLEKAQAQSAGPGIQPELIGMLPRLPWAVIRVRLAGGIGSPGDAAVDVTDYAADGTARRYEIEEVRIQTSMTGRAQVYADNVRVRSADVYDAAGKLIARVCDDDPLIEVG
jgi:hypothetical protein